MPANGLALRSATLHLVRIAHKTCWSFIRLRTHGGCVGEGDATLAGHEDALLAGAAQFAPLALRHARVETPGEFALQHVPADLPQASTVSALDQALWSLQVLATLGAFDMLELQFDVSPLFDALVQAIAGAHP